MTPLGHVIHISIIPESKISVNYCNGYRWKTETFDTWMELIDTLRLLRPFMLNKYAIYIH